MKENMKKELIDMIYQKSFRYSNKPTFKLFSGKMSKFYVDCKTTILDPRGMFLVGHLVFEAIKGLKPAGIGGLTFGADPIAVATAFVSELKNTPVKAFSIRKTQKEHGIIKWIEGDMHPDEQIVIIDDVATTGESTIKAIKRASSEGLKVVKAVILVDRQEGGLENIKEHVKDVSVIVTRDELIQCSNKKL
mmetsp:Transcript_1275/g.918  ORF Transcript_1275/g.918 Transcript_1275/m.918 type:complete len:191 (-) Transcript_1275:47-619(-)